MTEPAADDSVMEATGAAARLAKVYAEAVHAAAVRDGRADAVGEELSAAAAAVRAKPAVAAFLASGAVARKDKFPVLAAAFEANASELTRKFLGVLTQNHRLGLLGPVAAAYRDLRDAAASRVRATVTSAVPLTDDQLATVKSTLATNLRADPVLSARVDPDLLGGLVVTVGDKVFDTSVRTRLASLQTTLMAGSHGA
jgi:F-type H+-transporting ATPase subunit delta